MAKHSLDEFLELIHQQVSSAEALGAQLLKAKALLDIASETSLSAQTKLTRHAYFWALDDIIKKACVINEKCLDILLRKVH